MSDLISPDLASQLKGAPDDVKLRAAEILDQIKEMLGHLSHGARQHFHLIQITIFEPRPEMRRLAEHFLHRES